MLRPLELAGAMDADVGQAHLIEDVGDELERAPPNYCSALNVNPNTSHPTRPIRDNVG
jgi:hypothetical protein